VSIKIMSAIFETEFRDLPLPPEEGEEKPKMAKASSLKLVLLAIADHANDEGESAYPGLTRLERKTGLSRQGIVDVLSALKYNDLINVSEDPSRLGTNNYSIHLWCFPWIKDPERLELVVKPLDQSSHLTRVVKPLDQGSQATLPEVVKPLDHNHPLTINESSIKHPANSSKIDSVEWLVVAGVSSEEIEKTLAKERLSKEITDCWEKSMGYNPLSWSKLERLKRFLITKTPEEIKAFAKWSRREYSTFTPASACRFPDKVIELWPQAFLETPNKVDTRLERLKNA
jgi:hypothetical protein